MLTRAVTRGAQRPLVSPTCPFGSYQVSDEDAVRNAIRFVKEAGADAVKLEGAGPSLSRVAAHRRRRNPGHGPHRADAAVGDDARRLPGAREDRGEGAGRCWRTRSRSRPPGASRSCSRPCRRRSPSASARSSRSRRSASAPAPPATARCSSSTTCSASTAASRRASRSATRRSARRSAARSSASPPTCAPARSRPRSTRTRCRDEELEAFLSSPTPPARTGT